MVKIFHPHNLIWGTIGKPPDPFPSGIFQRRHCIEGLIPIRIDWYDFVITHTDPQQANRQKFASGISAWHNLSEPEKAAWRQQALGLSLFGISLFLRQWMLA